MQNRKGKIIPNGVELEKHEYQTILALTEYGFNIELIPPSRTKGMHSPDILINGTPWEMKSPQGRGDRTLEKILSKAVKQSENIILDLRRIQLPYKRCVKILCSLLAHKKSIKHLKIISKSGKIIDIK